MMIRRRTYILGAVMLILSATTLAHSEEPRFPGLEHNRTYLDLRGQNDSLLEREDSVQQLLSSARAEFLVMRDTVDQMSDAMDRFSSYIIELEQRIFELRQERGDIIAAINNIEQQYIIENLYTEPIYTQPDMEEVIPTLNSGVRDLTKNKLFAEMLSKDDYTELLEAQEEDVAMSHLVAKYVGKYNEMCRTAAEYNATTSEEEADSLYDEFLTLKEETSAIDLEMERRWNHILDTKYYAYGSVLEQRLRYDLLESSSQKFSELQREYTANDGYYASDALMRYVVGRTTLLDMEIDFAREMELGAALDSLQGVRNHLPLTEYRLNPVNIERRLFIDYESITFGSTSFYSASNPVPEVKIYERGTIYRILLDTFRNKQAMTLFKGVQPLYIEQNDEGNFCYYTGGFASRREADEAQLMLSQRGFKQPEVCRWRDGVMVNLSSTEDSDSSTETAPTGSRYIVILECDSIGDALREEITNSAPDKRISRAGANFVVGTFILKTEAESLISALSEAHPEITTTLKELDL